MDHFGISQAMRGVLRVFFQSSRHTGRTTAMLDSLKNGDRVVCPDTKEFSKLTTEIRRRDLDVQILVVSPANPDSLFGRAPPEGRTIFTHEWVELYFIENVECAISNLDRLQSEASGFGASHEKTQQAQLQAARWD